MTRLFAWGHGEVTLNTNVFHLGAELVRDEIETYVSVGLGFVSISLSDLPDALSTHYYTED